MFNFIKKKNFFQIFFILQSIVLFIIIKFYHNYNTYYYQAYALIFSNSKIVNDLHYKNEELNLKYRIHQLPEKGSIDLYRWFNPNKEINMVVLTRKEEFLKEFEYYFENDNYIKNNNRIVIYFINNKNKENLTIHAENFWNDVKKFISIPSCSTMLENFKLEYYQFLENKELVLKKNIDKNLEYILIKNYYDTLKGYIENNFGYYPKSKVKILKEINNDNKLFFDNEICIDKTYPIIFLNSKEKIYKLNTFNLINLYLLSISLLLIINFFLKKILNEFKKK